MANLGRGPEGTFSALDGRGIYAHAPAAAALYHAQLRYEITARLGVTWEPLHHGRADIAGIGPDARRAFSQRATAIAEHLSTRGLSGPRASRIAGHATRPERDVHRSIEDLRPSWEARAHAVGLDPGDLAAVVDRVPRHRGPGPDPGDREAVAQELAQRGTTVTRRGVVQACCASLVQGAPVAEVEHAADRLLESLPPTAEHARRVEGRGVGERRHVVGGREIRRERGELERLLAGRGMTMAPGVERRGGRAPSEDFGLGMG